MKVSSRFSACLTIGIAFAHSAPVNSTLTEAPNKEKETPRLRRRLVQSEGCILSKVEMEMANQSSVAHWECELQPTDADQAGVQFVALEGISDIPLDQEAVSGETTLFAEGAVITDGKLVIPKDSKKTLGKIGKRGPAESSKTSKTGAGRQLAPANPVSHTVLAVRVQANDGVTTANLATLSGDIFGTGKASSTSSLSERFPSCSYGEVRMLPYNGQTPSGVTIQNGVVQVQINAVVSGISSSTIHNTVVSALRTYLGISDLATVFDHVMLCLPPGTASGWIAYAYMNSWLSVFNDDWCRYPSSQVHEVGHNLGLNHAGEGSDAYDDRTGLMGYSYPTFNQKMCYNPAKSWQLGWYSLRRQVLDFSSRGGFRGSLIGINDYQNSASFGKNVHLKVLGGTETLYIGFNLQAGINADTQEGFNQVTVQAQNTTGVSRLRAKLSAGGQYIASRYLNGKDLFIQVNTINLSSNPPYAEVLVFLDGCPPGRCGTQCNNPCALTSPVASPTRAPVSTRIFLETFDNGLGAFQTNNGKSTTQVVHTALGSNSSVQMKSYNTQIITRTTYSVASYQQVRIQFWLYATQGVSGDGIAIEVSSNNGSGWESVGRLTRDADFPTDKTWYQKGVTWKKTAGTTSIRLRISTVTTASTSSSTGKVHLENVGIDGIP